MIAMAAREFIAICAAAAFAAGVLHADTPPSFELHVTPLADDLLLPPATEPFAESLAPTTAAPEKELFPLAPQSQLPSDQSLAPHPAEDRVSKFFRTGVLLGDRSDNPVKKLSVGPCEGGQLLNLRTNW